MATQREYDKAHPTHASNMMEDLGLVRRAPVQTISADDTVRKATPLATGCLDYFPDALAAVAQLSLLANEKHNPGEQMQWSKHKSPGHADSLLRHLVDRGKWDTEGYAEPVRHSAEVAWRALALLQIEIEADRK